jgi:hypothetical protein
MPVSTEWDKPLAEVMVLAKVVIASDSIAPVQAL